MRDWSELYEEVSTKIEESKTEKSGDRTRMSMYWLKELFRAHFVAGMKSFFEKTWLQYVDLPFVMLLGMYNAILIRIRILCRMDFGWILYLENVFSQGKKYGQN